MRYLGVDQQRREPDDLEQTLMVALHNRMCSELDRMEKNRHAG